MLCGSKDNAYNTFKRGVGCGIYTTNSPEACEYVLNDSKSRVVVVENKQQLSKILKIINNTNVRLIIQYTGQVDDDNNGLVIDVRILLLKIIQIVVIKNIFFKVGIIYQLWCRC